MTHSTDACGVGVCVFEIVQALLFGCSLCMLISSGPLVHRSGVTTARSSVYSTVGTRRGTVAVLGVLVHCTRSSEARLAFYGFLSTTLYV